MYRDSKRLNAVKRLFSPEVFIWFYPLLLIVPNIALDFTEPYSVLAKICNVTLPLGVYIILMGIWHNVGRTGVLVLFPVLFYGAFQIVLLFLYGESIIAVDMLLNVLTTNVKEATELLSNLASAIATICLIYIPALIWGTILAVTKRFPSGIIRYKARVIGYVISVLGILLMIVSYLYAPGFTVSREIFPINVVSNTITAVERAVATKHYHETSADFKYNAVSTHPVEDKEIYVLVIGETSRADNWQLLGYDRPTNPRLSKRSDIVSFSKVLSESNTTHKSVPMLLSGLSAENFKDSIYIHKSIISAFKEAGYATAFLSNQGRNRSFIDFYADEADKTVFLRDNSKKHYDSELIKPMKEFIAESDCGKVLIVLHMYGSHFNYIDRYPAEASFFKPDKQALAESGNRPRLINAYDNTIVQTDRLLDEILNILEGKKCCSSLIYVSDHGEDIFDDKRDRFLHASPVPTYYQIHVPMMIWMSSKFREEYSLKFNIARLNRDKDISSSKTVFNTMLHLAGISTSNYDATKALSDSAFRSYPRVYVNDYNEMTSLENSGLMECDFVKLDSKGISYK